MKKTTYILLGLVAIIFVAELAIGIYFYATRIPFDEYKSMHPEWYAEETVTSDDYYVHDTDFEEQDADDVEDEAPRENSIVIDASTGGYSVIIGSDEIKKDGAVTYYTDTVIITSTEKNIRVIR